MKTKMLKSDKVTMPDGVINFIIGVACWDLSICLMKVMYLLPTSL